MRLFLCVFFILNLSQDKQYPITMEAYHTEPNVQFENKVIPPKENTYEGYKDVSKDRVIYQ